ncbi:hypothetical protein DFP72DRAFT_852587 [Ephemerocybe angulata]|uniref:Uncharacterized protein n=1 Tax=Ephemerocybe angulata TaxID=980116 RepID=A0A8H6LZ50_9AGAR|nr:hypothetical protein DFP72DRAFT_852587 [Tulosesus angulatus]
MALWATLDTFDLLSILRFYVDIEVALGGMRCDLWALMLPITPILAAIMLTTWYLGHGRPWFDPSWWFSSRAREPASHPSQLVVPVQGSQQAKLPARRLPQATVTCARINKRIKTHSVCWGPSSFRAIGEAHSTSIIQSRQVQKVVSTQVLEWPNDLPAPGIPMMLQADFRSALWFLELIQLEENMQGNGWRG